MIKEGTPGKYLLRAVVPRSARPVAESFATSEEVAARQAFLEKAGYTVIVTLAEERKADRG